MDLKVFTYVECGKFDFAKVPPCVDGAGQDLLGPGDVPAGRLMSRLSIISLTYSKHTFSSNAQARLEDDTAERNRSFYKMYA